MNLVAKQRNGVRSVADFGQCRFRHHGESKPGEVLVERSSELMVITYPHGTVQGSGNVIVCLESGTAPQNLRQPELTNRTLHVLNLSMGRWGCFDPL